ncbi:unnamed protein product [Ambrosiozyma monospora]|uniref:Unnamed protein product n=1 Tax=Ambrosiozyma monospora TaxID=43982 RepID=A0ACB5T3D8_AMBMO|nr:unnamed protein product [Ambrosiozyma monospora]
MIVAVASDFLAPQHSPMFGHLASSQTVASFNSRTSFLTLWNDLPFGMGTFNQDGKRAFGSCLACSNGSIKISWALPVKKSANDGPAFNLSVNLVAFLLRVTGLLIGSSTLVFVDDVGVVAGDEILFVDETSLAPVVIMLIPLRWKTDALL